MNPQPSTRDPAPAVRIHIERLVVDGVPWNARQAATVQAAFERELARLIQDRGVPRLLQDGGAWDRFDAGLFPITAGAPPAATGRQMARTILASFSPTKTESLSETQPDL